MKLKKITTRLAGLAVLSAAMISCGSFGEGFLTGLAQYGAMAGGLMGSPTSRVQRAATSPKGGSLDYLLDPNYAIAQTVAQQQQWNQLNAAIMRTSVQQVQTKEELEYLDFANTTRKPTAATIQKTNGAPCRARR